MNKLGLTLLIGGCLLLQPQPAAAFDMEENNGDTETISLFATACEPIKAGEAKSSVRVRATDKASFKAVENIPELSDYRNSFSGHDFNVLVYYIVDNFMEDLTVRTTEQTEDKLCVEVNGYLNSENILKAFNENFNKFNNPHADPAHEDAAYPDKLELENDAAAVQPPVSQLPPKPQVDIKDELKAENISDRENETTTVSSETEPVSGNTAPIQENSETGTLVYIDKTKFFNDASTGMYFEDIKKLITARPGIIITQDKTKADYTVKSEVLRAKVDQINKQTSRMQMVIALELVDNNTENSIIEHQNRFILFESSENEQKVAQDLMRKLLRKAADQIVNKIKIKNNPLVNDMGMEAIITPTSPSYQPNRRTAE